MRRYREITLLVVASLAMIGYTYLTPPLLDEDLLSRLPWIGALPGDLPVYALRFLVSFVLLGLVPFAVSLALGQTPHGLGLVRPERMAPGWLYPLLVLVLLIGMFMGAYDRGLYAYYPYSRALMERVAAGGFGWFVLHALLYLILFYLPWEILFRGILLFPLVRLAGGAPGAGWGKDGRTALLLTVACLQALPSTALHFGHPFPETFFALPFGILLGWIALRTGSILPGLALHALAGIAQDLFIILRHAGALP